MFSSGFPRSPDPGDGIEFPCAVRSESGMRIENSDSSAVTTSVSANESRRPDSKSDSSGAGRTGFPATLRDDLDDPGLLIHEPQLVSYECTCLRRFAGTGYQFVMEPSGR